MTAALNRYIADEFPAECAPTVPPAELDPASIEAGFGRFCRRGQVAVEGFVKRDDLVGDEGILDQREAAVACRDLCCRCKRIYLLLMGDIAIRQKTKGLRRLT